MLTEIAIIGWKSQQSFGSPDMYIVQCKPSNNQSLNLEKICILASSCLSAHRHADDLSMLPPANQSTDGLSYNSINFYEEFYVMVD